MEMNVNISESAPRRLDRGYTAHGRNICPSSNLMAKWFSSFEEIHLALSSVIMEVESCL